MQTVNQTPANIPGRKSQRKFKNFIINPQYQMKYIFWLTFTGLFLVVLNASVFYHYISENYAILVELSPMTDEAKNQLYAELRDLIWVLGSVSLFFLVATSILGVIYSHRSAGPLYHFKRIFTEITQGKTESRVRLRPNDDFQDVAQAFNSMMDQIEKPKK